MMILTTAMTEVEVAVIQEAYQDQDPGLVLATHMRGLRLLIEN